MAPNYDHVKPVRQTYSNCAAAVHSGLSAEMIEDGATSRVEGESAIMNEHLSFTFFFHGCVTSQDLKKSTCEDLISDLEKVSSVYLPDPYP